MSIVLQEENCTSVPIADPDTLSPSGELKAAPGAILAELTFRDLEEIPMTSGPSLWAEGSIDVSSSTHFIPLHMNTKNDAETFAQVNTSEPYHHDIIPARRLDTPLDRTDETEMNSRIDRSVVLTGATELGSHIVHYDNDSSGYPESIAEGSGSTRVRRNEHYTIAAASSTPPAVDTTILRVQKDHTKEDVTPPPILVPAIVTAPDSSSVVDKVEDLPEDSKQEKEAVIGDKRKVGAESWTLGGCAKVPGWDRESTGDEFFQERLKDVVNVRYGLCHSIWCLSEWRLLNLRLLQAALGDHQFPRCTLSCPQGV